MEQPDFKLIAAQLRRPTGSDGLEAADRMNSNNANMIRRCIDHLPISQNDNILEIGPGGGLHVPYLFEREKDLHYTGADISDTMVELATGNNPGFVKDGSVKFVQLSIENGWAALPFPDNNFNGIFTVNTLYFWDDALAQAKEIKRVLKPGGILAVCFATETFMRSLPFTQYGFHLYTPEKAALLLKGAGFIIDDILTENETVMTNGSDKIQREFIVLLAKFRS